MDVAENVGNPRLAEAHLADRATFIEPEVKRLPVVDGEHVVEERVLVRKLDRSADWHSQHVRCKTFVLLQEPRDGSRSHRLLSIDAAQPNHHISAAGFTPGRVEYVNGSPNGGFLSNKKTAQDHDHSQYASAALQKRTPAARFRWSPVAASPRAGAVSIWRYSTANSRNEFGS